MTLQELDRIHGHARQLRRDVVTAVHKAGDGHPGPSLSIADIVAVLYFHVMRVDPRDPDWQERDRFILSKGHACPVVYAALARRGFFSVDLLPTLRSYGSILQGHPDMRKTPGIDMTTGSLGHGIAAGTGMAVAGRSRGATYNVYVICGDGELNEGIIWESAIAAANMKAGNLTVFVDKNGYQSGGATSEVSGMPAPGPIFSSLGWHVQEIDGHDYEAIADAVSSSASVTEVPSVIVCTTVKGKGVPFMENNNAWHKGVPTGEQLAEALRALGGTR